MPQSPLAREAAHPGKSLVICAGAYNERGRHRFGGLGGGVAGDFKVRNLGKDRRERGGISCDGLLAAVAVAWRPRTAAVTTGRERAAS